MQLTEMLSSRVPGKRVDALEALQALALERGGCSAIIAARAAEPLVSILREAASESKNAAIGNNSEVTVFEATRLLLLLAGESAGRATIIAAGGVPILISMITRNTGEIQEMSISLLAKIAASHAGGLGADRIRAGLIAQGVLPPMVEMLSGTPQCASLACSCVAHIAEYPGNCGHIVRAGVVQPLFELLRGEDPDLVVKATWALTLVSGTNESRKLVYEEGGLPVLLHLLENGDEEMQRQGAAALAALASRDEKDCIYGKTFDSPDVVLPLDGQVFVDANVIEPLVSLLKTGSPECKTEAARAVMQLSCSDKSHEMIFTSGVMPLMLRLLESGPNRSQGYVGAAMQFLATSEARVRRIEACASLALKDVTGPSFEERREKLLEKIRLYAR